MSNLESCIIPSFILTPFYIFLIIIAAFGVLTLFLMYHFNKFFKKSFARITAIFMSIIFFFVASFFTFIAFAIYSEQYDNRPAGRFHVVHAALKNTCYLDPERKNCPQNVEQIIRLDDKKFTPLFQNTAITYNYDHNTNQFTMIVRNTNPLLYQADTVAIFDSRLIQSGQSSPRYGYGYDFYETSIMKCGEKYELQNKPPFPGPWTEIN